MFDWLFSADGLPKWDALSGIGQVASAVVSLVGLPLIFWQIRQASKASDVQNLNSFYASITASEHAFLKADNVDDKDRTFYELANLLELQAMALHGGLYPDVTRKLVTQKLADSCAFIQLSEVWFERLRGGQSTPDAFTDLFRFMRKNRRKIEKIKAAQQRTTPAAPSEPEDNQASATAADQVEQGAA